MNRFPGLDQFVASLEPGEYRVSHLWQLWWESKGLDHSARHPNKSFFRTDLVRAGMEHTGRTTRLLKP